MADNIFLGLGSNLGDREANLKKALLKIADFSEIKTVSSVWESAPWGKTDQPPFLNLVTKISTPLTPQELLKKIKRIEKELGRKPGSRWGPREIDIDIIFWGHESVKTKNLTIPHIFWKERDFVLIPLAEIAPEFMPQGEHHTAHEFASELTGSPIKKLERIFT